MSTKQIQLEFTRKNANSLKFANEEEFFETLGILCNKNGLVVVNSIPGSDEEQGSVFCDNYGKIITKEEQGRFYHSVRLSETYTIKCVADIQYPKALSNLFDGSDKTQKIKCRSYIDYLIKNFGFELYGNISKDKVEVRVPTADKVRQIIAELGFEKYLPNFEKGLNAQ